MRARSIKTGRTARSNGEADEQLILRMGRRYFRDNLASIEKVGTPFQVTGRRGKKVEGFLAKGACCDFRGVLAGGRGLIMEAKGTQEASLPLYRHGEPILHEDQAEQLHEAWGFGGLALLIVRVRERWWVLTWLQWRDAKAEAVEAGRKSISPKTLDRYGRRCPLVEGAPDFLKALGLWRCPRCAKLRTPEEGMADDAICDRCAAEKEEPDGLPW